MNTHDSTDITGKIASTSGDSQVFDGVQPVGVDHEVSVVLVSSRGLAAIAAIEELCKGLLLNCINRVHIKPGRIAGQNDSVGLLDQLLPCRCFQGRPSRRRLVIARGILKALGALLWRLRLSSRIFVSFRIAPAISLGATHFLILRLDITVLGLGRGRRIEGIVRSFNLLDGGILTRLRFCGAGEY